MSCEKPTGWLCCARRIERQLEWSWGREEVGCWEEAAEEADGVAEEGLGLYDIVADEGIPGFTERW